MAFYLAGKITQVKESIPWVRCASGNVLKESLSGHSCHIKRDLFITCSESALDLMCLEELIMVEEKIGGAQGDGVVEVLAQVLEEDGERLAKGFRYLELLS